MTRPAQYGLSVDQARRQALIGTCCVKPSIEAASKAWKLSGIPHGGIVLAECMGM